MIYKQLFLILITAFFSSQALSQTSKTISWDDIKGTSFSMGTYKNLNINQKRLTRHLNRHTRRFKKQWTNRHVNLGKSMIKKIFDNLEVYYVPKYNLRQEFEDDYIQTLSKYTVNDIFFIYDNYYLGDYSFNRSNEPIEKGHKEYWNKWNYNYILWHYTNYPVNKEYILDIFAKGSPFFSIEGFSHEGNPEMWFWFIKDDYSKPVIFDRSEVCKNIMIDYDDHSKFKSQYTNTNNK